MNNALTDAILSYLNHNSGGTFPISTISARVAAPEADVRKAIKALRAAGKVVVVDRSYYAAA